MTHTIAALVAPIEALERFSSDHSLHRPTALHGRLGILPLRDIDLDAILPPPMSGEIVGFTYLSDQLQALASGLSTGSKAGYFETSYFGGTGAQAAATFEDGKLVRHASSPHAPWPQTVGPVNRMLQDLGVRKPWLSRRDEWDIVDLRRFRTYEDFGLYDDDEED